MKGLGSVDLHSFEQDASEQGGLGLVLLDSLLYSIVPCSLLCFQGERNECVCLA